VDRSFVLESIHNFRINYDPEKARGFIGWVRGKTGWSKPQNG
jgi:hypothetical protein